MTIIYIYRSLAVYGGIEKIFVDKINYLAENFGYDIYMVTYEQGSHPIVYPLSPKVKHVDLQVPFYKQYRYNLLKRLYINHIMLRRFIFRLKELVASTHAEIVVGTTCEYTTLYALYNLRHKVKTVIESHTSLFGLKIRVSISRNVLKKIIYQIEDLKIKYFVKNASMLVCITRSDAEDWSFVSNISVVMNMLSIYPQTITEHTKKEYNVISVGRLVKQKGYDLLLNIWSLVHERYPEWILNIYGDGDEKANLLKLRENLNLKECVNFCEPTLSIYDKYCENNFSVMSSRWEGFGLVLVEAMSCGLPCISFDCPHGPADIIKDGENGFLIEKSNLKAFADNIIYLIEHEDVRKRMGEKARESVRRYLPENVMPQWKSLFESLINK